MRWERELPQILRKLRNQHVHYAQTIRILLEPITNEFELAELLQDPNGKLWKGNSMAKKLGARLGDSYNAYQSTIADIERITRKIASKLDVDRAAEVRALDWRGSLRILIMTVERTGSYNRGESEERQRPIRVSEKGQVRNEQESDQGAAGRA